MKQYRLAIRYCQVKVIFFQTGQVCTKFNTEFSRIQRTGQQCAECPIAYNSTLAFQCKTYVHFYKDALVWFNPTNIKVAGFI